MARKRKLGGYRPPRTAQLKMTSMMDILVVLLLFLIKSFVADGQILTPAQGVELPTSTSDDRPEESLVIAIYDDTILMDDEPVARLDPTAAEDLETHLVIEPLAARLAETRQRRESLQRLRGEDEADLGRVTIQGDRAIEFATLRRVMYTLSTEGFTDVSLAVIRTS